MTTFYHHDSMRHQYFGYVAIVEEHTPFVFRIYYEADVQHDPDAIYGVRLPSGRTITAFPTREAAIKTAVELMLADGWTTDRSVAERRAAKEVELRKSGRLRFAGPQFRKAEFEACQREIIEYKP